MPIKKYYGKPREGMTHSKQFAYLKEPKLSSFDYLKIISIHLLFLGLLSYGIGDLINLGLTYQDMIEVIIFLITCFGLFLSIRGYIRAWL